MRKKILIYVVTFLLFSFFISVGFNVEGVYAESNENVEIPFFDDFTFDIGWVNETFGDFIIDNGRLNWNADRGIIQRMYLPINSFSGNFQLSFDFQLTYRQNNIWLIVGLAESLTGAHDLKSSPLGTFIRFGWIGGGTPYNVYYVIPLGYYPDQYAYQGGFNFKDPSTYIPFTEDSWYHAALEVNGMAWKLTVSTPGGQQVGQKTGYFPSPFGAYNYIYIGNEDYRDWPEGYGYLDNLEITKTSITVEMDIKPQSCPNPLNVKSKGVLPVAVLGTEDFDVTAIDPASIRLKGVASIRSKVEDVSTPVWDPQYECDCTTEGKDGFDDLTLKFNTREIVEALGEVTDGEVLELTLTGELTDGTPIEGKDCIIIISKGKNK